MTASLKIFVLSWTVVAGVSFADNENIGEPRNGMLGIYFNPQDPVSRLAAIWWSRFFEKFSYARPTPAPKPTAPAVGSQPPKGQNEAQTTTAKPPQQMVQLIWPQFAGMMPQPGGGPTSYYPNIMQAIPYPQQSQQGQQLFAMQGQPQFGQGQQNQGGAAQTQQNTQPGLQSSQVNQVLQSSQGQGQFLGFNPVRPQSPQQSSGINHGPQYPPFPSAPSVQGQSYQQQQFVQQQSQNSGLNLPLLQQQQTVGGRPDVNAGNQQQGNPNTGFQNQLNQQGTSSSNASPVQQQFNPSGQNSQQRPQQFQNNQQQMGQFQPQFQVPGQQQQSQFQPAGGLSSYPSQNQVFQVRSPDGRDGTVISMENMVIDGQRDVANVTNGMILNNGTIISNTQEGSNEMQVIPLHSMLLVFPLRSNGSNSNGNEAVIVGQNAESINDVVTTLENCGKNDTVCAGNVLATSKM